MTVADQPAPYVSNALALELAHQTERIKSATVIAKALIEGKQAMNRHPAADLKALCADKDFKAAVIADLAAVGKAGRLQSFELARDVHLEETPWLPDNDPRQLLTPTFKFKRAEAKKHYAKQIDAMYAREAIGGKTGLKVK